MFFSHAEMFFSCGSTSRIFLCLQNRCNEKRPATLSIILPDSFPTNVSFCEHKLNLFSLFSFSIAVSEDTPSSSTIPGLLGMHHNLHQVEALHHFILQYSTQRKPSSFGLLLCLSKTPNPKLHHCSKSPLWPSTAHRKLNWNLGNMLSKENHVIK